MKLFKNILYLVFAAIMVASCNEGIDPISRIEPGEDILPPVVDIKYPNDGTLIRVKEDVTSLNIQFEVTDDIEIKSISVKMNGTEIANFSDFKDYRRALKDHLYNNLTNGNHVLMVTATDLAGKTSSKSVTFEKVEPYQPKYAGEKFYMPFDGDYLELINIVTATKVGNPGFAGEGVQGNNAYAGETNAYLTYPTTGLLSNEFSAVFWYKVNATPDRAGILVIGPPDPVNPSAPNNRKSGFRLFRENAAGKQRIKLNVGNGTADSWFDGGAAADIDPTLNQWVHVAFTISNTYCAVYLNGIIVKDGTFTGVNWDNCTALSIASGAPNFTGWNHLSDRSFIDELRIFNKALTQQEIQAIMDEEK